MSLSSAGVVWGRVRRTAPVLLALWIGVAAGQARAHGSQSVVIVRPDASTCVDSEALSAAMANAGAILPSVVPEDVAREAPAGSVVFRIESGASGLRIRAWGLRHPAHPGGLEDWPVPWTEQSPDLDREIPAPGCETATEAVVALLVSVLAPPAQAERLPVVHAGGSKLAALLDQASAELAQRSHLTAGVLHTELGLTFIVEDVHASCRRGTWLDLRGTQARMGQTVAELERDVQACLAEREVADRQLGLDPKVPARRAERFGLPALAGAVVAGLGAAAGYVAVASYDNSPAVLAFTAVPAVVGGAAGYLASGRGREALWVAGYWGAVAGSSLVAAAQTGAAKPVLVGSFLAGGAASSAALVAIDAMSGDGVGLPSWAISLPAASGAALAWIGQSVSGNSRNSVEIATIGSIATLMPAVWIAVHRDPRADAGISAACLGVSLGEARAALLLQGAL